MLLQFDSDLIAKPNLTMASVIAWLDRQIDIIKIIDLSAVSYTEQKTRSHGTSAFFIKREPLWTEAPNMVNSTTKARGAARISGDRNARLRWPRQDTKFCRASLWEKRWRIGEEVKLKVRNRWRLESLAKSKAAEKISAKSANENCVWACIFQRRKLRICEACMRACGV